MTRSKRMERVTSHAENEQFQASTILAELQRHLHFQEARLAELREYLLSYRQPIEGGGRSMQVYAYRDTLLFLDRLKQAIQQQEDQVALARTRYQQQLQLWHEKRARVKAMEKVSEQCRQVERRALDKREQKDTDDQVLGRMMHGVS